eukprot:SAG31_NODE_43643_length_266_cov_0.622754_1_plen_57_part_10
MLVSAANGTVEVAVPTGVSPGDTFEVTVHSESSETSMGGGAPVLDAQGTLTPGASPR